MVVPDHALELLISTYEQPRNGVPSAGKRYSVAKNFATIQENSNGGNPCVS
jgi:hypothetical protein